MFYVNIRVLEFWVMEITNIYDFLHLLNLIKIRLNMDFGGDLTFVYICHNIYIYISMMVIMLLHTSPQLKVCRKKIMNLQSRKNTNFGILGFPTWEY